MPLRKLLVADDSLTIQKVIRLALGQSSQATGEGFDIQTVSDGRDTVQQIAMQRPEVVLIDVSLPNKNAFEVKREINEMTFANEVRFILLSSAFETVDQDLYQATGFHGHLTKPFDPAYLRTILNDTLAELDTTKSADTRLIPMPTTPQEKGTLDLPLPPPIPHLELHLEPPLPESPSIKDSDDLWTEEEHLPDLPPPHFSSSTESSAGFVLAPPVLDAHPEDLPPPLPTPGVDAVHSHTPKATLSEREEIKLLMENTLGESNTLDDLGWSLQEPPRTKVPNNSASSRSRGPTPPPVPAPVTSRNDTYDASHDFSSSRPDPSLRPAPGLYDRGGRGFQLEPPTHGSSTGAATGPTATEWNATATPEILPLTSTQMEEIIERQLNAAIQKLAQKLLPDMAEKILKDEIHKMLAETPQDHR